MHRSLRLPRSKALSKEWQLELTVFRCYELYKEYCKMLDAKLEGNFSHLISNYVTFKSYRVLKDRGNQTRGFI